MAKPIVWISLLLAFAAGFADAATFVAADELFSAHVTGNFIVFAYDLVRAADVHAWLKLLSFPVFLVSVMLAGALARRANNDYLLLFAEGLLLLAAAALAWLVKWLQVQHLLVTNAVAMLIVFALAFQNAFGRLNAKATLGPTTVMTGNVTQAALDALGAFLSGTPNAIQAADFRKQLIIIGGFLAGSLLGAFTAQRWGLAAVAIPGLALVLYFADKGIFRKKLPGAAG